MKINDFAQSPLLFYATVVVAIAMTLMLFVAFHVVRYIFHGFILATIIYCILGHYRPRYYFYSWLYALLWLITAFIRI